MSELIGEARVVVRPDTTRFRAELAASLANLPPVQVPVTVSPVSGAAVAGQQALQQSARQTVAALETQAAATVRSGAVSREAARAEREHARQLKQVQTAALANAAGLIGLRGAVLTSGAAFLGATVGIQAFVKAVSSAAALETELNVFRVTAGATADEMERVSETARTLGSDISLPGVSSAEAAQALTALAKAGLEVEDAVGGVRGVLQLAIAAQIDTASSAELVANSLNAFSLAGTEAVRVADLLTGAANESQGSILDMGIALRQASAVASLGNISIEDTVTILTQLARAGVSGSDAGTSFRTALIRLFNPTKAVRAELEKLGVAFTDIQGDIRPEAFGELQVALNQLAPAARRQSVAILGGSDAIRTFGILARQGADDFREIQAAITESGLAQEQAGARTQGFQGDLEALSNSMGELGTTVGQIVIPPLSLLVGSITDVTNAANQGINDIISFGSAIADLGGDILTAIPFVQDFKDATDDSAKSFAKHALVIAATGPYITAARGIGKLTDFMKGLGDQADDTSIDFQEFQKSAFDAVNALTSGLSTAAAAGGGGAAAPAARGFGVGEIQNIVKAFDAKEVRARINKDNQELLAALREEQDFLIQQLQRDFVQRRPELRRELERALLGTVNDIDAVLSEAQRARDRQQADAERRAREAEARAREAAARQAAANQAVVDQFTLARDQLGNQIAAAAITPGLQDDIRRQKQLQALIKEQIAGVRARITDEKLRNEVIAQLTGILIQTKAELKRLAEAQKAAQEEQRRAFLEALDLDIELAEIQDNETAEVAARTRKINVLEKALRAEAKAHGKNTLLYKQLRNEIARERAAIEDVKDEEEKRGTSFEQATFQFLQAQQGFAANLLGNLIPTSAATGLVGTTTPAPEQPLPGGVRGHVEALAGAAAGSAATGPTSGQMQTEIAILLRIERLLAGLNRDRDAPEATREQKAGLRALDYMGVM